MNFTSHSKLITGDYQPGTAQTRLNYRQDFGDSSRFIRMSNSGGVPVVISPTLRYAKFRECLKNHAFGIGKHAVDGCGEFMAAGTDGTLDALMCAACNCHRNFHRREPDLITVAGYITDGGEAAVHHHHQFSPYHRTQAGYLHLAPVHMHPPPQLALRMSREAAADQEHHSNPNGSNVRGGATTTMSQKRFRTKFTNEQKDRMRSLAETLGWRIQKHDEEIVQQFCSEFGVKRHVLKVWMHNNKNTIGKKST